MVLRKHFLLQSAQTILINVLLTWFHGNLQTSVSLFLPFDQRSSFSSGRLITVDFNAVLFVIGLGIGNKMFNLMKKNCQSSWQIVRHHLLRLAKKQIKKTKRSNEISASDTRQQVVMAGICWNCQELIMRTQSWLDGKKIWDRRRGDLSEFHVFRTVYL